MHIYQCFFFLDGINATLNFPNSMTQVTVIYLFILIIMLETRVLFYFCLALP